jgi:hypothetical protein
MRKINEYWLSEDAKKVFEIANAEQKTLQPVIARIINQIDPKALLDYGCGDSFVSRLINAKTEISLYDINLEIARKAKEDLNDRNVRLFLNPDNIPDNYYECINFSLVLICISNKEELRRILSYFKRYLTTNGKLIFTTTHPCFRQYKFRPFYADYAEGRRFSYFNELEDFQVFIRDGDNPPIQFTDFHWTLQDTINELVMAGFTIEKILEIPDQTYDNIPANGEYPPFLTIICN